MPGAKRDERGGAAGGGAEYLRRGRGRRHLRQLLAEPVVVFLVLAVTVIPVVLAQRLTRESGIYRTE